MKGRGLVSVRPEDMRKGVGTDKDGKMRMATNLFRTTRVLNSVHFSSVLFLFTC
jgi:hypothetical protein